MQTPAATTAPDALGVVFTLEATCRAGHAVRVISNGIDSYAHGVESRDLHHPTDCTPVTRDDANLTVLMVVCNQIVDGLSWDDATEECLEEVDVALTTPGAWTQDHAAAALLAAHGAPIEKA